MKFKRHFTDGSNPFECVKWTKDDVELTNMSTGAIIFKLEQAEVPLSFDRNSREILVTKYFRMTEIPTEVVPVAEISKSGKPVPNWLKRSELTDAVKAIRENLRTLRSREDFLRLSCDQSDIADELKSLKKEIDSVTVDFNKCFTNESSAKQVFHRLAGFWAYWGWMNDYFDAESDAKIFYDESIYMLANQIAAPNTPQWFNSGLHWAYGLEGEQKGFWRYNPGSKKVETTPNFYQFPGLHACLAAGTPITMWDSTTKPIEDIKVGDSVVTHFNRVKNVIATNNRKSSDNIELGVEFIGDIVCTADHKWSVIKKEGMMCGRKGRYCDDKFRRRRPYCFNMSGFYSDDCDHELPKPRMVESRNITPGDYIKMSFLPFGEEMAFDLSLLNESAKLPFTKLLPNKIVMTPDLSRLFGYYLAEGDNDSGNGIRFTLGEDEDDIMADIVNLMSEYFNFEGNATKHLTSASISIRYSSVLLSQFFSDTCGVGALNKKIHGRMMKMPRTHMLQLLKGLIDGDGCLHKGYVKFGVVSKQLRDQIFSILLKFGCLSQLKTVRYEGEGKEKWNDLHYAIFRASRMPELFGNLLRLDHARSVNGELYVMVKFVKSVEGTINVYDFEVDEDHTFTVAGLTSSNCHILGVTDSLFDESGIYDNLTIEAKAFAIGGGVGKNTSNIRTKYEH